MAAEHDDLFRVDSARDLVGAGNDLVEPLIGPEFDAEVQGFDPMGTGRNRPLARAKPATLISERACAGAAVIDEDHSLQKRSPQNCFVGLLPLLQLNS